MRTHVHRQREEGRLEEVGAVTVVTTVGHPAIGHARDNLDRATAEAVRSETGKDETSDGAVEIETADVRETDSKGREMESLTRKNATQR